MPSLPQLPSATDDYAPPPGTVWNPATWNATIVHMAARIRAVEAVGTTLEDIIAELQVFGLQRLDEAIVPLIEAQQAELAALQLEIAAALAATQALVDDFQGATTAALTDLQTQIDASLLVIEGNIGALQDQVDLILAGGLSADDVVETATRVFLSPAQRAAIGDTATALTALAALVAPLTAVAWATGWTTAASATLANRAQEIVDTSGGARTRLMPLSGTATANMGIRVMRMGSNLLTINANGSVFKTRLGNVTTLEITVDGLSIELARTAANDAWVVK